MRTKLTSILIVSAMLLMAFSINIDMNAHGAFINTLSGNGLNPNFIPLDTEWNTEGTMAVVVGQDVTNGPNAYMYWPHNDTYFPISNYVPGQILMGVDCYSEPVYNNTQSAPASTVLLVDADCANDGLVTLYDDPLVNQGYSVTIWDVYGTNGPAEGKPQDTDMSSYDLVVWIPSRDTQGPPVYSGGETFDSTDQNEVGNYLDGGGNFFLSNIYWSSYLPFAMPYSLGEFTYDYLGLSGISNTGSNRENAVMGNTGDSQFDGFGTAYLDWNLGNWGGTNPFQSDEPTVGNGEICAYIGWDMPPLDWGNGGVKYDAGTFKSMFMGFPVETLQPADADDFWARVGDFFELSGGGDLTNFAMLNPSQDNTIYEEDTSYSNGAGQYIFTGMNSGSDIRRALVQFDLEGSLPEGSTLTGAALYLYCSWSEMPGNEAVSLHALQEDWGEGISDANPNEEYGTSAAIGDATWNHRYYSSTFWASPGGEYDPSSSAITTVGVAGSYYVWTSAQMKTDVQNWIDNPEQNNGWMVRGNEGMMETAKGFSSVNNSDSSTIPILVLEYTNPFTQEVVIESDRDNGMFSEDPDQSNGAGEAMRAGANSVDDVRRGLIHFDVAGNVPADSIISYSDLQMTCRRDADGSSRTYTLQRMTNDWGEGISDDGGFTASGNAEAEDATWDYNFYSYSNWGTPGGDFDPTIVSSQIVTSSGQDYTWSFTSEMQSNIQSWLDDDSTNYGWLVRGDETLDGVSKAKHFYTREYSVAEDRPQLTIRYTPDTLPDPIGYNDTFWLCGDDAGGGMTCVYKVVPDVSLSLVNMGKTVAQPLTSIACDDDGNPLAVGHNQANMFYYDITATTWYDVGGTMLTDCDFEGVDYNPNDGRFYVAGYNGNWAWPVVYYTDPGPLNNGTSSAYYYQSTDLTSDCYLYSIAWNELYDYGLAVGEEGHILKVWPFDHNGDGTMMYEDISINFGDYYYDVSWDTDGWDEAGIVGSDSMGWDGLYYRYYQSNPEIILGHDSNDGSYYRACAMKPPSSPKWLFIPTSSGGVKANIQALDQSSTVSASSLFPNIYWAGLNDTAMNSKNNMMINPDSDFYITFEANYSGGWNQIQADIHIWYDDGWTGTNSQYPAETPNNRNWAINLTYDPNAGSYVVNYPSTPVLEATIGAYSDTIVSAHPDPTQSIHRVELPIHFGGQMFAADGSGSMGAGPDYHTDPNIALDRGNTWDFNVTLYDSASIAKKNSTYGEFGVNQAISISIAGNPSGDAPPGSNGVYLGSNVITYSTNTNYWVNMSIPDLDKAGGGSSIPASNLQVQNTNGLSTLPSASEIGAQTYFSGADQKLCVWGISGPAVPLASPGNGTTAHGPWGSNYNNYGDPGGTTSIDWYIDLPSSLQSGIYTATITYSIETQG